MSVDRLVTYADRLTFKRETAGDLLGRPALLEAVDHRLTQLGQPDQLATTGAPGGGITLRIHAVVTIQIGQFLVAIRVALDLAIDRRAVPTDLRSDLADRHFCVQHILDRTSFA